MNKLEKFREERKAKIKLEELQMEVDVLKEENEELKGYKQKIALKTREELRTEYENEIKQLKNEKSKLEDEIKGFKKEKDSIDDRIRKIEFEAKELEYQQKLRIQELEYQVEEKSKDIVTDPKFVELTTQNKILEEKVKMLEEQSKFYGDNSQTMFKVITQSSMRQLGSGLDVR